MGRRLDYLMGLTLFRVVCPECGRVGTARWMPECFRVRCPACGATFDYRPNTYRPVTGGMTDEERREHELEMKRARYCRLMADPVRAARHREYKRLWRARKKAAEREARRRRINEIWRCTRMGKRDTLGDLTDHLFAELERLGDEGMTPEQLDVEIKRANAISDVAQVVINNANTVLKAAMFQDGRMDANGRLPRMLTEGD